MHSFAVWQSGLVARARGELVLCPFLSASGVDPAMESPGDLQLRSQKTGEEVSPLKAQHSAKAPPLGKESGGSNTWRMIMMRPWRNPKEICSQLHGYLVGLLLVHLAIRQCFMSSF